MNYLSVREWEDHADKAPQIFDEKVFISIGSGIRDTMVQPYQTILHGMHIVEIIIHHSVFDNRYYIEYIVS